MSGFLAHLVQRTFSNAPDVRPRPASLFEPMSTARQLVVAHDEPGVPPSLPARAVEEPQHAAETTVRPVRRQSLDDEPTPFEPGSIKGRLPTAQGVESAVEEGSPVAAAVPPSPTRPVAKEIVKDDEAPPALQARPKAITRSMARPLTPLTPEASAFPGESPSAQAPVAMPARPQPLSRSEAREPAASSERAVQESGPPVSSLSRTPERQRESSAAQQREFSPAQQHEPSAEQRRAASAEPRQAVLVPRLPPAQPLARPPQPIASAETKAAEPTVHVTIGRVEIRAVAAPAAPKRPAPPKPTLSLADYLDRREGGRR